VEESRKKPEKDTERPGEIQREKKSYKQRRKRDGRWEK
jgi:hypothetical protein